MLKSIYEQTTQHSSSFFLQQNRTMQIKVKKNSNEISSKDLQIKRTIKKLLNVLKLLEFRKIASFTVLSTIYLLGISFLEMLETKATSSCSLNILNKTQKALQNLIATER